MGLSKRTVHTNSSFKKVEEEKLLRHSIDAHPRPVDDTFTLATVVVLEI